MRFIVAIRYVESDAQFRLQFAGENSINLNLRPRGHEELNYLHTRSRSLFWARQTFQTRISTHAHVIQFVSITSVCSTGFCAKVLSSVRACSVSTTQLNLITTDANEHDHSTTTLHTRVLGNQ